MAGSLVTAAQLNTGIRDNENALRAGGIAIASQAALDLITADTSTQLKRTAAGTGLQIPRINAGATAWEFYTPTVSPTVGYTPTIADCTNTTSITTILSFTIGANVMANGDDLFVELPVLGKNNKGTSGTVTLTFSWNGTTVALPAKAWIDDPTEGKLWWYFHLIRVGSDVWVRLAYSDQLGTFQPASSATDNLVITAPDFTTSQAVLIRVTLSAADATFYVKPQTANVYRVAKQ